METKIKTERILPKKVKIELEKYIKEEKEKGIREKNIKNNKTQERNSRAL